MAETLLGLEVAFYLYPCGLFVTLLAAQSYQFYRDRHGVTRQTATDDEQKKASRLYARIIWGFQLILSLLLVSLGNTSTDPELSSKLTLYFF